MLIFQLFLLPIINGHKQRSLTFGKCTGTWSSWGDRDNPGGTGDHEFLDKRHDTNQLCEHPIALEGRIKGSEETVTTQNVKLSLKGLHCKNNKQGRGKNCFNYEVRFCCDESGDIISNSVSNEIP